MPRKFDALLLRAQQTSDPLLKLHLYSALASVADPALARRMIDVALGDEVPAGAGERGDGAGERNGLGDEDPALA